LELKVSEDIHLVVRAVDYWLRVRFHHEQGDFSRFGYFPEVPLDAKPPLPPLVAPGFRFHPSIDIVLRYSYPEIEIARIALAENWRRGLHVVFRQGRRRCEKIPAIWREKGPKKREAALAKPTLLPGVCP
jgi:hypothetical protein